MRKIIPFIIPTLLVLAILFVFAAIPLLVPEKIYGTQEVKRFK